MYCIAVNNLFDTELACRFLGFKESGLNAVLKKKYNVQLDKKNQRKDWSKRPLPEDMVAYAAKDVHTLRTFLEAESYDGPSLIIAFRKFSSCPSLSPRAS